jgi:hypothetical protein
LLFIAGRRKWFGNGQNLDLLDLTSEKYDICISIVVLKGVDTGSLSVTPGDKYPAILRNKVKCGGQNELSVSYGTDQRSGRLDQV